MIYKNPFHGMAYITEKNQVNDVLKKYSTMPIKKNIDRFMDTNNIFLIGRRGIGKTMILTLFDPEYQNHIYNNYKEFQEIADIIPEDIISVYIPLQSPAYPIKRFQGKKRSNLDWQLFLGDYFGFIFLEKLIETLNLIKKSTKWQKKTKFSLMEEELYDEIAKTFSSQLAKYIDIPIARNWVQLLQIIENRIDLWLSVVSSHSPDYNGPNKTIDLIKPSNLLLDELKNHKIFPKTTRLFIILDQYDYLFTIRKPIDFRPLFNHSLAIASRGKTGVEFKIGVRPYGFSDNLSILNSDGKLDIGKECIQIDLDNTIKSYYSDFIKDLTLKCLRNQPGFEKFSSSKDFFEDIDEFKEIEYYIGKSTDVTVHFHHFTLIKKRSKFDEIKNLIQNDSRSYYSNEELSKIILHEIYLCVYLEKELRNPRKFKNIPKITIAKIQEYVKAYGKKLYNLIEKRIPTSKNPDYPLFNECKHGVLFILSQCYSGRALKIYSGLSDITKLSSKITLHYVEIVDSAVSEYLIDKNPKVFNFIPFKYQTRAVHKISKKYFDDMIDRASYGLYIERFFNNIGNYFKNKQILPNLPKPTPNGFSLKNELLVNFQLYSKEWNIYAEILGRGLLEMVIHNTAGQDYKPFRYKYYFNRLLCPYFNLSYLHRKTPIYLQNVKDILSSLVDIEIESNLIYKNLDELIKTEKNTKLDSFI